MKASDYIVSFLESQGVDTVFGYIGGMITHLVDSIDKNPNIRFVQTYHEQTAAIAAEGYALESGNIGVAISTSGPGATNMMTGIADAYFDSIPVLYITGQVNSYEYKYDKPIRQQGFQETDIVTMVKPITKYTNLVDSAEQLKFELEKAVFIAKSGRKGPVLLDICMDVQRTDINPDNLKGFEVQNENVIPVLNTTDVNTVIEQLEKSRSPMLLCGAGCIGESLYPLLNFFCLNTQIPVVTSLMGRGCLDETYDYYLGMIGSYGNRCANIAIAQCDLLLVLGSRLDTRQTGTKTDLFLNNATIIHVDIDKNELDYNRIPNRIMVYSDVASLLREIINKKVGIIGTKEWKVNILDLKNRYNQDVEIERFVENKAPYRLLQYLNDYTKEGDIVTTDVGQNQMWVAQTIKLKKGQKMISSGGLAPMGYSLPVAIGMSFASPQKCIYAFTGDGGLHISIQSLMLVSQYDLPIKIIVFNNSALGMITQFQHLYFNNRMTGTTANGGYNVPDMSKIAESYGLLYIEVQAKELSIMHVEELRDAHNCLFNYVTEGLTVVSPKLEYNKAIYNMTPSLNDDEINAILGNIML